MTLVSIYLAFLKIGAFAFGGGYAMIPLLRTEMVNERGWLTTGEFADLISVAQITPGPIAINSATFVGYRVAGVLGSFFATIAVVTPSMILVLALAKFLMEYGEHSIVQGMFTGIKPVVMALIVTAAISVGNSALINGIDLVLAAVAGIGLYIDLNPIAVIVLCGGLGALLY